PATRAYACVFFNDTVRPYADALRYLRRSGDDGGRMYAAGQSASAMLVAPLSKQGLEQVGFGAEYGLKGMAAGPQRPVVRFGQDDGPGPALQQLVMQLRVGKETDLAGACRKQRAQAPDPERRLVF